MVKELHDCVIYYFQVLVKLLVRMKIVGYDDDDADDGAEEEYC